MMPSHSAGSTSQQAYHTISHLIGNFLTILLIITHTPFPKSNCSLLHLSWPYGQLLYRENSDIIVRIIAYSSTQAYNRHKSYTLTQTKNNQNCCASTQTYDSQILLVKICLDILTYHKSS